jgi:hypothetical protein
MNARAFWMVGAVALALSFGASRSEATTVMFTLPLSPTPEAVFPRGAFDVGPVPTVFNGAPPVAEIITFFSAAFGPFGTPPGGVAGGEGYQTFLIGSTGQLYSGTESSPTFLPGMYSGGDFFTGKPATVDITAVGTNATFDITIGSVVPLPSSWMMMLGGLAGVGFMAYRGANKKAVSPAV